ncbi:MAG: lipopolysaccharide assembly protein LapA domain-containing protein [Gammaproteobacteria bacterium]
MNIKAYVTIILILLSTIFIVQNLEIVEVHFFLWQLNISRAVLVILLLLIGFLIGWLLHGYFQRYKSRQE